MKVESSDTFVGLNVDIGTSACLSLSPMLDDEKWKLQHGKSAKSVNEKIGVLYGQICSLADRILNANFSEHLRDFLAHAISLGYTGKIINGAMARFYNRYPYLELDCKVSLSQCSELGVHGIGGETIFERMSAR